MPVPGSAVVVGLKALLARPEHRRVSFNFYLFRSHRLDMAGDHAGAKRTMARAVLAGARPEDYPALVPYLLEVYDPPAQERAEGHEPTPKTPGEAPR